MKFFYKLQFLLLLSFSIASKSQPFENGVLVLNEGGFAANNASMSFINSSNVLQNNVYAAANSGAILGDTTQSMFFSDQKAYVVLNGTGAIKILNRYTLQLENTVSGLINPRFITKVQGNLFVTCWGSGSSATDDYVAVIDGISNSIIHTIPVSEGAERIFNYNNKLYVAHQGGYGYGNTVSVLDATSYALLQTISVGDVPNSLAENNGILYILCGGKPSFSGDETTGRLVKFDLNTNQIINTIVFPNIQHPSNIRIDGSDIYFTSDANIFKMPVAQNTLPTTALFSINPQGIYGVYGLDIFDAKIYISDAVDYIAAGKVYVYATSGTFQNSFTVGIIPNGCYKATPNLATNSVTKLTLEMYPNPSSDKIYLNTNETLDVIIYDLSGRIVKTETYNDNGIVVSDLNKGIYIVKTQNNYQSISKQLVIK
jgi:hypothetical protein